MKTILLLPFFFLIAFFVQGQNIDSLAVVREVDSLIQLSRTITGQKDFDKALEINAVAERIALEKWNTETAAYGNICFNRGRILYFKGDFPEAEKWYLKAKSILEGVLGKEHPDYAWVLNNLGNLYFRKMTNYKKAEPLLFEAKAIREKVLGKENSDYINSLKTLMALYFEMGNYEQAEPLMLEVKSIQEKIQGKENPGYASILNNLGVLYEAMGNYEKAEPFMLEAQSIQEKVLGKENPDYAFYLSNLGLLYRAMENYKKAELCLLEAKSIQEKVLGKENPDYAFNLSNLGSLYEIMSNYKKAELCLLEAKSIQEKVLGKENPDYASSLGSLGNLYRAMGNYGQAELCLLEVKSIQEKIQGKEHPDYASSLGSLGRLYRAMGNYEQSELFLLEAKSIQEKVLGKEHPNYVRTLRALSALYGDMGNNEKAEPLLLEVKATCEKVLGKENPDYAFNLNNLGLLYGKMGNYKEAEHMYDSVAYLIKSMMIRALDHLSEQELDNFLHQFSLSQDEMLSFAQGSANRKSFPVPTNWDSGRSIEQICYDNILFYKGFLLNAANRVRTLALSDSVTTEKFNLLKSYHHRLATEYAKPVVERQDIADLEEKANTLEKELTRSVAGYGEGMRQVNWQDVCDQLHPGEAALEFAHYYYQFKKVTDSTMYAALLLRPGDTQPKFIPLFEERQLDSLFGHTTVRKADYVNNLYTLADRGVTPVDAPHKSLYELIWQPLEKDMEGVKTVYFSPSGLLHRLNLGAIPLPTNEESLEQPTLADRYQLVQLGSTRSIAEYGIRSTQDTSNFELHPEASGSNAALLYGGIRYDMDSTALRQANASLTDMAARSSSRGTLDFAYTDTSNRGGAWGYLRATELEVKVVEYNLKKNDVPVILYTGYAATEESFKRIGQAGPSPRILHLATHGYFFPDPKGMRSAEYGIRNEEGGVFKISEHPMIRSGLILAGANQVWKGGQPLANAEDGILTAYEISQMNLSNTELVVLSACETGLGDIQGNEGVYGLQRAFKIAGAKYLIMSLWQVDDSATQELMTMFYTKWLEAKIPIPEAFRAAQQSMREKYRNQPYLWAGFVLVE